MTTKSALHYLKQLPEAYFELATEYITTRNEINQMNAPCESLPEALKRLNVWHPNAAREGYSFWSTLYYHYCGVDVKLPEIPQSRKVVMEVEARSFIFQEALNEAMYFKQVMESMYMPMNGSRKFEQVAMRMIVMSELYQCHMVGLSLATIGKVVAKICDRKTKFDHSTVLHSLNVHNDLLDANDRFYVGMYEQFRKELKRLELPVHTHPSELDAVLTC